MCLCDGDFSVDFVMFNGLCDCMMLVVIEFLIYDEDWWVFVFGEVCVFE